jgi:FlaG/FlaF family flagellin (archaellin)
MKHVRRNLRAISPVLAVLMMIAVAIAGALVTYAWVMGYINFQTQKSGETIQIHSVANLGDELMVYVQNVGETVVQLDEQSCLYVDGILVPCDINNVSVSSNLATLGQGDTAQLTFVGGAAVPGERVPVKVTTISGTSAEQTGYPAGSVRVPPVLDHFEFDYIPSPQTAGVEFTVIIRAVDQYGELLTSYNELIVISHLDDGDTQYSVWTGALNGIKIWNVTFNEVITDATINVAALYDSSKNGTSNCFDVNDIVPTRLIVFEDDFESYSVGTFPDSGGWDLWYNGMGTGYQVIVDSDYNSPTQSLHLLGSHSANWAAYAVWPFETDIAKIGFTVSVKVSEIGVGDGVVAEVGFGQKLPPNRMTTFDPIYFRGDGTLIISGASVSFPYVADQWYKVTVILDRDSETYSCWIDDELQGEGITVRTNRGAMTPEESTWDIEGVSLNQLYHSTSVYFDDVTVFYVP